jgi:HAD superfamily hydrolase (TIGR01509 family)
LGGYLLDNIEWLFFDVGSTLVDESKAYRHRIDEAIKGTDITYQMFIDTMLEYYRKNLKGDLETIKQYGLILPKWDSADEVLYPEAKTCLSSLHKKYRIGIIANQSPGTIDRLQAFDILRYIDLVIASAEEGVSKPDLQIFRIALERAGCLPQHAVMIGDRLDNDIAPANMLGMHTVWIKQGFGRYSTPGTEAEKADDVVDNLNDIVKILSEN